MALIGVLLALGSALFASLTDVVRKQNSTLFDPIIGTWALHGTTFLLAVPVMAVVHGIGVPSVAWLQMFVQPFPQSSAFWLAFGITVVLNSASSFLSMRALAQTDLSLASPIITLSPVFILLTAPFITGEIPSWLGVVGILVTTSGLFLLATPKGPRTHVWSLFIQLFRHPAHRDLLVVAVLYALVAPWEKRVVVAGGSLWYMFLMHGCLMLLFLPLLFRGRRWRTLVQPRNWLALLPFGFLNLIRSFAQFTALGFLPTFYVIALKRSGVLFSVLWGRLWFHERETPRRMLATGVMLCGALLVLWASLSH